MSFTRSFAITARARAVTTYFVLVFLISWGGGGLARLVLRLSGATWSQQSALVFFPILIATVAAAGILMTAVTEGRDGLRRLSADMGRWRVGVWYATVLLPPACILVALGPLRAMSNVYTPNFFPVGFLFGVPAGFLEEIGWSGFALPAMTSARPWPGAAIILGLAWGLWHLPVIDSLGAASPHRAWWLSFAVAFILVVAAERVIISWTVARTRSVLLAQLIHVSATGSLVMLTPTGVSPAQETLCYASYALVLWAVAAAILQADP